MAEFDKKFTEGRWIADFIDGKPVYSKHIKQFFSKALDSKRKETLREAEKEIRKAKTNLDEDGDNKYWINEGVLRCQIIINNLKTKK